MRTLVSNANFNIYKGLYRKTTLFYHFTNCRDPPTFSEMIDSTILFMNIWEKG